PYLYYGEEIGMVGIKPDQYIREPFLWDKKEKDQLRATWIQPRNSTDSTIVPLAVQQQDKNSLLNFYKSLISLRNQSHALTYGELSPVKLQGQPALCAFARTDANQSLLVIHNLGKANATVKLP